MSTSQSAEGLSSIPIAGKTLPGDVRTFTGCLRNAAAVARAAQASGERIGVIAAGEQWPDGTLRPCVEDLLGAGAILSRLRGTLSPECELARDSFLHRRHDIEAAICDCASGRELIEKDWREDVVLACELDVSNCAPVLRNTSYCAFAQDIAAD